MIAALGFATKDAKSPLAPYSFQRRELRANDILIEIDYSGICHSDIHQARDEWGGSIFPMVPGHEIVGRVTAVGTHVRKFKKGELAGVGCFVDSCRACSPCKSGEEQYCETHLALTYNGREMDRETPTYGGYANNIVVDENYALKVPSTLELAGVAPLLCAGITTYAPLKRWKVGKGHQVGVLGLGGLGHMAVKLAASFGADVTVLSSSKHKEKDAEALGAKNFLLTKDSNALAKARGTLDFIVNTVSAPHDIVPMLNLLNIGGTMIVVGAPDKPLELPAFPLLTNRRNISGSLIGGIAETQEMLDYCARKNIVSTVEVIPMQKINEAYERMIKGDVRYRFVIDMKSLT